MIVFLKILPVLIAQIVAFTINVGSILVHQKVKIILSTLIIVYLLNTTSNKDKTIIKNENKIATMGTKTEDERPFLNFSIYGKTFYGLLDSGYSISILGKDIENNFLKENITLHCCNDIKTIVTANNPVQLSKATSYFQ